MAKWTNKGHEFDEIGNYFREHPNIIIAGTKVEELSAIKKKLNFLGDKAVTTEKINMLTFNLLNFMGRNYFGTESIVVVPNSDGRIYKTLKKVRGLLENKNLFTEKEFLNKYLSIFAYYITNQLYSPFGTCQILTTLCTLNCKYCLNFQPYIKEKKHTPFENLKNDVDIFFSVFDRVEYFAISGGEPLLYKQLPDLIEYIGAKYKDKINHLWFATNGTLVPSDDLCKIIEKYNVEVICDNYTKSVPELKESYAKLIKQLKKYNIHIQESGEDLKFFKVFPPAEDYTKWSENAMLDKFNLCKEQYSGFGLQDGKLYQCCYSMFADTADLIKEIPEDTINLKELTNKKELLEFILGYTEKGYSHFCEYCNCFYGIKNGGYDENGVTQQPRNEFLNWDINNPHYLDKENCTCQK